jgi:hypothetical protein
MKQQLQIVNHGHPLTLVADRHAAIRGLDFDACFTR